ncbi:MAG: 50S ribosomal protein L3 N(5)-glutamine methyltransferase [Xanthomonadales bacterium]|nr:50S ribosomal protein L3 N(5)-glutamine methyltransferase [Xanthomonadales bacterium]
MRTAENWLDYCAEEMKSADLFFGHGTDNARDEAAWMLLHVLAAPLDGSFSHWDTVLTAEQGSALEQLLARRINQHIPLAYLTGEARFCNLDFIVTPDVLIPRSPLAETIREQFLPWVDLGEGRMVLDMCTGGACIAIAMAVYIPGVLVDAVDISQQTLGIAAQNVERHEVGERVRLIRSDLFDELEDRRYDLIVSNPPYVSTEAFENLPAEYRAEPSGGLVCGEDGLDIVLKILDASPRHMNQTAVLVVEVGESAETLLELLPRVPFLWLEFDQGGDGIFLLEYDQLIACQPDVRALLEQRENV